MVLGLRTKTKKSPTVQVDYLIHIQEIKPWPPSQSLRTIRSVIIQWEHGDRNSGCTNTVVPSFSSGSDIGDGKIEFNNSFRLPATLMREMPIKGGGGDTFQKNCIEFNLYEPRRDKTVKGQLLGTAIIDLADYGVIKETLMISATMNCKRSYRNTSQPVLFLQIQPIEKSRASSSSDNLLKEALMDKNGGESVSALMDEEYAEEAEIASFTDDDVSSHSSVAISSSALESNGGSSPVVELQNGLEAMKHSPGVAKVERVLASKQGLVESDEKPVAESNGSLKGSSFSSSSTDLPSELVFITRKIRTNSTQPSSLSSSMVYEGAEGESKTNARSSDHDDLTHSQEKVPIGGTEDEDIIQQHYSKIMSNGPLGKLAFLNTTMNPDDANFCGSQASGVDYEKTSPPIEGMHHPAGSDNNESSSSHNENEKKHQEKRQETDFNEDKGHSLEIEPLTGYSSDGTRMQKALGNDALFASSENSGSNDNILNMDRSKHVKSVRSLADSTRGNGLVRHSNQFHKTRDVNYLGDAQNGFRSSVNNERKDKVYLKETRNTIADGKIHYLENRIKMLEGELREAAAIEVGLYSVIAEHGSSISKVHAPARRLSRLYLHSHKEYSQSRSASAAQSAISALVLVAKAGGHDVPRLTFWLSNSIVLRAIISQALGDRQVTCSAGSSAKRTDDQNESFKKSSSLKWESVLSKDVRNSLPKSFDDWEDPCTFSAALEKIEAWIFSRIVESIWWQALTPHMQSASINEYQNSDSRKIGRSKSHSGDQEGAFSLELWKKAFKDACEKICPIRAGGHECGCLPMLSRLIMEQCVARLDVAMFNAILRDSADEIPTDPMSDPISDVKVLPIPAGKASFGAGAQLKNAIGSWSRWLTDLCGIDDDDTFENEDRPNNTDYERKACDTSFKPFYLLNALSDLMMLPKDMLLSGSIRKEVCPAFGPSLIRRVLANFAPDEFCPDPIPDVVLEALNSEDPEAEDDSGMNFSCTATQIVYLPPSAALVVGILEDTAYDQSRLRRSGSSVLKKSNTSDDELDELDSPLKSIIIDNFRASSSPTNPSWSRSAVRYQLLRDVWLKSE